MIKSVSCHSASPHARTHSSACAKRGAVHLIHTYSISKITSPCTLFNPQKHSTVHFLSKNTSRHVFFAFLGSFFRFLTQHISTAHHLSSTHSPAPTALLDSYYPSEDKLDTIRIIPAKRGRTRSRIRQKRSCKKIRTKQHQSMPVIFFKNRTDFTSMAILRQCQHLPTHCFPRHMKKISFD